MMPRLTSTYMLCVAGAALALAACSEDESPQDPSDAGAEVARACTPADCQSQRRPPLPCSNGTTPEFTCSSTLTGKCEWMNPRCGSVAGGGDAGTDAQTGTDADAASPGADAGESDGGHGDAGDADLSSLHDPSGPLSDEQRTTLVDWLDAGAPGVPTKCAT